MDIATPTADDLLAGAGITFDVAIPPQVLYPAGSGSAHAPDAASTATELVVQLRPITIGTFQLIMKAARNDPGLIPLLMIKEALVQPTLTLEQVKRMHLGMVNFLIAHIRTISGLDEKKSPPLD
jgi:hypothetical protein